MDEELQQRPPPPPCSKRTDAQGKTVLYGGREREELGHAVGTIRAVGMFVTVMLPCCTCSRTKCAVRRRRRVR